jgi:DTW domain-containing protein YfiP
MRATAASCLCSTVALFEFQMQLFFVDVEIYNWRQTNGSVLVSLSDLQMHTDTDAVG